MQLVRPVAIPVDGFDPKRSDGFDGFGENAGVVEVGEEEINFLFDAIATLSPLNKAIILLYLDDLSYDEIAGITGLTKSNVSVKLVRIKKELEKILKEKE